MLTSRWPEVQAYWYLGQVREHQAGAACTEGIPVQSLAQLVHANKSTQFEDAGLHPVMLANIKLCKYDVPTPIQAYCIPSVLQGQDVIAIAQTGKYLNCYNE